MEASQLDVFSFYKYMAIDPNLIIVVLLFQSLATIVVRANMLGLYNTSSMVEILASKSFIK